MTVFSFFIQYFEGSVKKHYNALNTRHVVYLKRDVRTNIVHGIGGEKTD